MYQNLVDLVDQLVSPQSDSEDESMEVALAAGMYCFVLFFVEVAISSKKFYEKRFSGNQCVFYPIKVKIGFE